MSGGRTHAPPDPLGPEGAADVAGAAVGAAGGALGGAAGGIPDPAASPARTFGSRKANPGASTAVGASEEAGTQPLADAHAGKAAGVAGQGADVARGVERGLVEDGVARTAGDGGGYQLAVFRQRQQQDDFAFQPLGHGLRRIEQVFRQRGLGALQRCALQAAGRDGRVLRACVGGACRGADSFRYRLGRGGRQQARGDGGGGRGRRLRRQPDRADDQQDMQGEAGQQGEVERHWRDSRGFPAGTDRFRVARRRRPYTSRP